MTPATDIASLLEGSPAVQLLRMRNAGWVLPFLYRAFKESGAFSLPEGRIAYLLAETLGSHAEGTEDLDEARIPFGEGEESRARKYLQDWVQRRILQDFPDAEGVPQYQLSAHAEKVFQWLQTLKQRRFVGTNSRFRMLFTALHDIVEKTGDDHARRLEELKHRRAEIDKEIKALEMGVRPEVYSNAQLEEHLELFTRLGHELLGDFREVEDNFKQIHRNIVEQHTKAEVAKGAIIGYAFEAYDALRNSDQGRSFYAFWDFLISRAGQEEWRALTDQLLEFLDDRAIPGDHSFLQNIKSLLLQQGRSVYEANDRMADKLSRIITEKEISRYRRLRQQIGGIKELALQLRDEENISAGLVLDEPVRIRMTMDRKLTLLPKEGVPAVQQPEGAVEQIGDPERFSRLLHAPHIDRRKLWGKVEHALALQQNATLKEIIQITGLEHGLAEVVSFYSFLRDRPVQVQIIERATEHIPLNESETKVIEVPYLLFSREPAPQTEPADVTNN